MPDSKLPPLNEHRLLAPGVHDATLEEVGETFGSFQRSDRRCELFKRLEAYVREVGSAGWGAAVIVDGSFVMPAVDEPNDIDVILVLPSDWDLTASLRPYEYNLISKRRVKKKYGFDLFTVRDQSTEYNQWVEFFQGIRPERRDALALPRELRKGIVRLVP